MKRSTIPFEIISILYRSIEITVRGSLNSHGNGDRWKAILKHIYDDLKDTNDGGEYVEIKNILYVPSPVAPDPWLGNLW